MGLLDSIRDRVASTVTQAKEAVSETVTKVETRAAAVGHEVKSAFEPKPSAPPPPAAPLPVAAKIVSSGPASLRNDLNAAAGAPASSASPDTVAAAKAIKERSNSFGFLDHDKLGKELAQLVKDDPAKAAPIIREVMQNQLKYGDGDDVAEVFANQLSRDDLAAVARHPDGKLALRKMQEELRGGASFAHEKLMADKIGDGLDDAEKKPLPNTKIELPAGSLGVNSADSRASPSGKIPAEMWADPSKLMGALTQNPAAGQNAGNTCGPSSMLASTLMGSPEKAARFLENVAKNAPAGTIVDQDRADMNEIAGRIRNKSASFEDLAKAQKLMFNAAHTHGDLKTIVIALETQGMERNKDFKNLTAKEGEELHQILEKDGPINDADSKRLQELASRATGLSIKMEKVDGLNVPKIEGDLKFAAAGGLNDAQLGRLATMGGLAGQSTIAKDASITQIAAGLKPGEAVSVRVAATAEGEKSNHFITIGKRDDGTMFLYNSDPAQGDATLTVGGKGEGTPEFRKLLASYNSRQRSDPNNEFPKPVPFRLD